MFTTTERDAAAGGAEDSTMELNQITAPSPIAIEAETASGPGIRTNSASSSPSSDLFRTFASFDTDAKLGSPRRLAERKNAERVAAQKRESNTISAEDLCESTLRACCQ
mmetsp:Transcript_15437/g.39072  ORF Transcript_15437/g.39072 Transcript_15437/m.39072 type:complete len:109 (+) Transcript_15437:342-668(+)